MALRLNLYHEVIRARALKRRDPLKFSIYGISAVLGCFALWYFFELVRMHAISDEFMKAKKEFANVEPLAKAAKKREDELNQQAATSVKMVKRIEGRFYWAPLLAELTQVVPREVQITRLTGELTGDSVRRCSLSIDGLSAGTDPRRVAEDLRTAIADRLSPRYNNVTSTFKTLEDGSEMVMLDGKQVGTATFAIIVQLTTAKTLQPLRTEKEMKLGKEEIQKIVLGGLLLLGVVYSYFDLLLGPLMTHAEQTQQGTAALGPEIANARAQVAKTKQMEVDSPKATLPMRQALAMIPDGSPVAWFPTRTADFFKKQGIDKAATRMTGEATDKELPGFRRITWGVDLPKVDYVTFAQAVAALENEEPLLEITALQIDASRDDVETQHVFLTVNNLVKQ